MSNAAHSAGKVVIDVASWGAVCRCQCGWHAVGYGNTQERALTNCNKILEQHITTSLPATRKPKAPERLHASGASD
jgi:hypothetical protein